MFRILFLLSISITLLASDRASAQYTTSVFGTFTYTPLAKSEINWCEWETISAAEAQVAYDRFENSLLVISANIRFMQNMLRDIEREGGIKDFRSFVQANIATRNIIKLEATWHDQKRILECLAEKLEEFELARKKLGDGSGGPGGKLEEDVTDLEAELKKIRDRLDRIRGGRDKDGNAVLLIRDQIIRLPIPTEDGIILDDDDTDSSGSSRSLPLFDENGNAWVPLNAGPGLGFTIESSGAEPGINEIPIGNDQSVFMTPGFAPPDPSPPKDLSNTLTGQSDENKTQVTQTDDPTPETSVPTDRTGREAYPRDTFYDSSRLLERGTRTAGDPPVDTTPPAPGPFSAVGIYLKGGFGPNFGIGDYDLDPFNQYVVRDPGLAGRVAIGAMWPNVIGNAGIGLDLVGQVGRTTNDVVRNRTTPGVLNVSGSTDYVAVLPFVSLEVPIFRNWSASVGGGVGVGHQWTNLTGGGASLAKTSGTTFVGQVGGSIWAPVAPCFDLGVETYYTRFGDVKGRTNTGTPITAAGPLSDLSVFLTLRAKIGGRPSYAEGPDVTLAGAGSNCP